MAEGPRLSALLVLLVINLTYSGEVQRCENTPVKQIICEFGTAKEIPDFDTCLCTHIAVPVSLESEKDDETPDFTSAVKSYKQTNGELRSLAAVSVFAEDVAKKTNQICREVVDVLARYDGVQVDLRQSDVSVDKSLVVHFFKELSSEINNKFNVASANNSLDVLKKTKEIQLVLPPNAAVLTKYYDLKKLSKFVNFFIIATHNLVDNSEQGYTYHPSRLMGADDLLNADSLIDLVVGLGVDHTSIILSLPSTASKFELKDPTQNTPRSPAIGLPTTITRQKMCEEMKTGNWTIERDEDLTAPYAFMNNTWMSFDDSVSVSIKGKYILLRDLAGAVVTDVEALDWKLTCLNQTGVEPLKELAKTFTETARKSRSAQLLSLQEQLLQPADQGYYFNNDINYSPYYIERVVTRDGEVHVVRKDTKTEFECSRQGYFRHPSGCNRFYRCVKFDQNSNYFTVYEYDCPDGLAFDEKVEVCVWPGSLSNTGACQGSSEIAPVPRNQFVCPPIEGYYADPENCRWFFACLDHAKDGYTPLTAYEFRCPFGLVFDEKTLKCDWEWKVGSCGNSGRLYGNNYGEQVYQSQQFNTLYEKEPLSPYGSIDQDRPRYFSLDSTDTYSNNGPSRFLASYSTTARPEFAYVSTESHVSSSAAPLYNPVSSYAPSPSSGHVSYGPTETYVSSTRPPARAFYGSTETYPDASKLQPQSFYGSTGAFSPAIIGHEQSSGSAVLSVSHATASEPPRPLFYGSAAGGHSSAVGPHQYSYGPAVSSSGHSTTVRPHFAFDDSDTRAVPNQPGGSPNFGYSGLAPPHDGLLGVLYHQRHGSESASQYRAGASLLYHQQNNFQSIPVNRNYDSHRNDVQYPPLKDYETHSTTPPPGRLNGIPVGHSPSDVHSHVSVSGAHGDAYPAVSTGASGHYGGQYGPSSPSYDFATYSTTRPSVVEPSGAASYSLSNAFYGLKPTTKPFEDYTLRASSAPCADDTASRSLQYSTTTARAPPSSTAAVYGDDYYRVSPATQKPAFHDTSLYRDQFKSHFNFDEYLSRLSSPQYPSTTPAAVRYPSSVPSGDGFARTTAAPPAHYPAAPPKPTVFYYDASPAVTATERPAVVSSTTVLAPPPEHYGPSSVAAHSPTFRPTVGYYEPSSTAAPDDDSAFVRELIAKLSENPIPVFRASSTTAGYSGPAAPPSSFGADYASPDAGSFDVDEYVSRLYAAEAAASTAASPPSHSSAAHAASLPPPPPPTTVYLSTPETDGRVPFASSTTSKQPGASVVILSSPPPEIAPYVPPAFSARPPAASPAPLLVGAGYSSTVSNLIDYYHDVQSSLDSAYRSPVPGHRALYAAAAANYSAQPAGHGAVGDAAHGLRPIVVEPVSAELNAEFERYYTAGVREHLRSEHDGRVLAIGDASPPLVGKLGAQCDCGAKKKRPTVVSSTTTTIVDGDDDDDDKSVSVKEVETKTRVVLDEVKKPSGKKLCTRAGLFRDPKQCNKFYSCNWDKWTQKYELSEFKCPIHLAFDENLSACNWPSKGPACSHDTLISYSK